MDKKIKYLLMFVYRIFLLGLIFVFFIFLVPTFNNFFEDNSYDNSENERVEEAVDDKQLAVIGNTAIEIEIADSHNKRIKGLSGQTKLHDDTGLFFIFEESDYHGIWMKDMNFSIDIIWFDDDLKIIHIEENISPETYPKTFGPDQKSSYVLELPAGFTQKNDIQIGDPLLIL